MTDLMRRDHGNDSTPGIDSVPDFIVALIDSAAVGGVEPLEIWRENRAIVVVLSYRSSQSW